tara:strand:+ start:1068 stop:1736 length:669 start_codon:yes stop_codon:yes gene_type:complete
MARKNRMLIPNVPIHVTQRGNRQANIFIDDEDKEVYMNAFMFYKKKFKIKLYAWALMDNHIHFVIESKTNKGIVKLFSCLNTKYAKYFNKKYELTGRLYESRYKSCLLDEDHFYEAIRYVELNPFKAKMETAPSEYYWTSAHERLKRRNTYYLSRLPEYFQIENWWEYLTEKITLEVQAVWQQIKVFTQRGTPIGNNKFIQIISKQLGVSLIPLSRGRPSLE